MEFENLEIKHLRSKIQQNEQLILELTNKLSDSKLFHVEQIKPTANSFLQIGFIYFVRTSSISFFGRLVNLNDHEFLFENVKYLAQPQLFHDFWTNVIPSEFAIIGRSSFIEAIEIVSFKP